MRNSCLVGLVILGTVLLTAALLLQRCFLPPGPHSATEPLAVSTPIPSPAATRAEPSPFVATSGERVDGLRLESVQPLLAESVDVAGLAAIDGLVYLLTHNTAEGTVKLYELDGQSYAVRRVLPLSDHEPMVPVGLAVSADRVWVMGHSTGSEAPSKTIVLDRDTFAVTTDWQVADALSAIAIDSVATLYGVDQEGRWVYVWDSDGQLLGQHANPTGMVYSDCEFIRKSLVCVGDLPGTGSVLDVLDPHSLSLLARHHGTTQSRAGSTIIGNTIAHDGQYFYFVPLGGEFPLIWSYVLDGTALSQYIPSTWAGE